MTSKLTNRRRFIQQLVGVPLAGQAAVGTLAGMAASPLSAADNDDYRALVCVFLLGGNDSFNMLVPRSSAKYKEYALARGELALERSALHGINPLIQDGADYGFHPAMSEIQSLFDDGDLAVAANVGALVEPTSRDSIQNNSARLPPKLLAHSSQHQFWQDIRAGEIRNVAWASRLDDGFSDINNSALLPMNVSVSGRNLSYLGENGIAGAVLNNTAIPVTRFDENHFANSLKSVAHLIAARNTLAMQRQIFFVGFEGWDTHDNQADEHARLLATLSGALNSFNTEMQVLGCHNNVTTFTASDFGRTLTSNGDGSDHGWGGHQLIMGGAVAGQRIHGNMPSLAIGGPQDAGGGRIIPDSSFDQYGASLAKWFGVSNSDLDFVFPNLANFDERDLGLFEV